MIVVTWEKMFFLSLLATLPFLNVANIITLRKNREIACLVPVSEEPIFLNPPVKAEFTKASNEIGKLINSSWLDDSHDFNSAFNFILDKRWEDFKILDTSEGSYGVYLNNTPKSLSVYLKEPLMLKVMNTSHSQVYSNMSYTVKNVPAKNWFHVMMSRENNTIHLLSVDKSVIVSLKINFDGPYWVYIESDAFFKAHEPQYQWSNVASNGQEVGYLNVSSFSDNLCLSTYVALDKGCTLQMILESNNATETELVGFNAADALKEWTKLQIMANTPGTVKVSFSIVGHEKSCYCAIGKIEHCMRKPAIYGISVPETSITTDYRCEMLNRPNASYDRSFLENTPGYLDKMSCAEALGSSSPYCEKHKICLPDSDCFCSWGYQGSSCDKTCEEGRYGLSCLKQCTNCTRCDRTTGACSEENRIVFDKIHVKYVCVSKWCYNETFREESYNIYSSKYSPSFNHNFKGMVPFTKYKPVVTMTKNNKPYEESYDSIEVQPELGTIKDFKIDKTNETTLWIKFKPPQNSFENTLDGYGLWYRVNSSEIPPNYVEASQCELHEDILCAIISNLKSNTSYDIVVMNKNLENEETKFSSSITISTLEAERLLKENESVILNVTKKEDVGETSSRFSNSPTTTPINTSIAPHPGTITYGTILLKALILFSLLFVSILF